MPVPTPDPNRPFGQGSCEECKGKCSGHYMKPDKLWEHVLNGGEAAKAGPPSDVILSIYQQYKAIPSRDVIEQTAEQVLLPFEEVEMWFQHLQQTSENRVRGAKRAAETRKRKARQCNETTAPGNGSTKSKRGSINYDESVCKECSMSKPPDQDGDDDSEISWI